MGKVNFLLVGLMCLVVGYHLFVFRSVARVRSLEREVLLMGPSGIESRLRETMAPKGWIDIERVIEIAKELEEDNGGGGDDDDNHAKTAKRLSRYFRDYDPSGEPLHDLVLKKFNDALLSLINQQRQQPRKGDSSSSSFSSADYEYEKIDPELLSMRGESEEEEKLTSEESMNRLQEKIDSAFADLRLRETLFDSNRDPLSSDSLLAPINRTLVLYVYREPPRNNQANDGDDEDDEDVRLARDSLKFFLDVGVDRDDHHVEYLFILVGTNNNDDQIEAEVELPSYDNVRSIHIPQHVSDYEAWLSGIEALLGLEAVTSRYEYIVLMNVNARGPFLPPYWPSSTNYGDHLDRYRFHWSRIFTSRLSETVKLVGPSVVCLPPSTNEEDDDYTAAVFGVGGPALETFFLATDRIGLRIIADSGALGRKESKYEMRLAEVKMTKAIMEKGYTIDTLALAYSNQRIDWSNDINHQCNQYRWPSRPKQYFGVDLNPLETVFFQVFFKELERCCSQEQRY